MAKYIPWADQVFGMDIDLLVKKEIVAPTNITLLAAWKQWGKIVEELSQKVTDLNQTTSFPNFSFTASDPLYPHATLDYTVSFKLVPFMHVSYELSNISIHKMQLDLQIIVTKSMKIPNPDYATNKTLEPFKIINTTNYVLYPYHKNQAINFKAFYSSAVPETNNLIFANDDLDAKLNLYKLMVYKNQSANQDDLIKQFVTQIDTKNAITQSDITNKLNKLKALLDTNTLLGLAQGFLKLVVLFNNKTPYDYDYTNKILVDSGHVLKIMSQANLKDEVKPSLMLNAYEEDDVNIADLTDPIMLSNLLYGVNESINKQDISTLFLDDDISLYQNQNDGMLFNYANYKVSDLLKADGYLNGLSYEELKNTNHDVFLNNLLSFKKHTYGNSFNLENYVVTYNKQKINITKLLNHLTTNNTSNNLITRKIGLDFTYDFETKTFNFFKPNRSFFVAAANLTFNDIKQINDFLKHTLKWNGLKIYQNKTSGVNNSFILSFDDDFSYSINTSLKDENDLNLNAISLRVLQLEAWNKTHPQDEITDLQDYRLKDVLIDTNRQSALLSTWNEQTLAQSTNEILNTLLPDAYLNLYKQYLIYQIKRKIITDLLNCTNSTEIINKIKGFNFSQFNNKIYEIKHLSITKTVPFDTSEDKQKVLSLQQSIAKEQTAYANKKRLN